MIDLTLSGICGYILGAIPTGVIISRLARGTDVRQQGSGHTGGLNVSRVTGFWGGAATALIDALLGLVAVVIADVAFENPWAATSAGMMAVVGHDWSILIRWGGGIGLSTLVGALFALDPLRTLGTLLIVALFWLVLIKLLRLHRARSTILAMLIIGPLAWLVGFVPQAILLAALGSLVVIIKTLPDWNRQYE